MPYPNIFLIDDDPICMFLTRKMISSASFHSDVTEFHDGQAAIRHLGAIAEKTHLLPDIIFLDLHMPILDGWGFLDEFSLLYPSLKKKITLFIVSSSISPNDIARSKCYLQVEDYLVKPLDPEQLKTIFQTR
jgi:CheY-like chemotaxis protein